MGTDLTPAMFYRQALCSSCKADKDDPDWKTPPSETTIVYPIRALTRILEQMI